MTGSHEVRGSIPLGSTNTVAFDLLTSASHTFTTKPILKTVFQLMTGARQTLA